MPTNKNTAVDQRLIRDLADILNETDLTEIEVEQGDMRVRISRHATAAPLMASVPAPAPSSPMAAQPAPDARPKAGAEASTEARRNAVSSPMVGTAYKAAAPGEAPFIEIGQTVREGQTLLIIEAMKTMNQVPSPRAGTVTAILFEDMQPVEYGEPLVIIE